MHFLEWLTGSVPNPSPPRSIDEIRRDLAERDAPHLERLDDVEESLLQLTAEVGLVDLHRRLREIKDR